MASKNQNQKAPGGAQRCRVLASRIDLQHSTPRGFGVLVGLLGGILVAEFEACRQEIGRRVKTRPHGKACRSYLSGLPPAGFADKRAATLWLFPQLAGSAVIFTPSALVTPSNVDRNPWQSSLEADHSRQSQKMVCIA